MAKLILLVDDDDDCRESLATLLGTWGYEVDVAPSGERAVWLVTVRGPDVVVLDLALGSAMDGMAVVRGIKDGPPPTPFIIGYSGFHRLEPTRARPGAMPSC